MKRTLIIVLLGAVMSGMTACHDTTKTTDQPGQQTEQSVTDSASFYLQKAMEDMDREQMGQAMLDVNKSIQLNPDNIEAFLLLSDLYYLLGDEANITASLNRAMELDPFDARPVVKMAELSLLQQNYNLAFGYLDNALKISTFNPQAYFVKGMTYMAKQDTASALKNFLVAREQDPNFYEPQREICVIYLAQQNPLAEDFMRSLVNQFPDRPTARYELALFLQDNDAPEEALAHYDTLLQLQPNNSRLLFNKGYVYFVYLGDNQTALDYFTQSYESDPDYIDALYNMGHVYEQMGDYAQAMSIYKQVLNRYPNYQLAVDGLHRIANQAE